jgi:hypothetical protein
MISSRETAVKKTCSFEKDPIFLLVRAPKKIITSDSKKITSP